MVRVDISWNRPLLKIHFAAAASAELAQNLFGEFADIEFGASAELLGQMVPKGSVAIDGVSLTIAEVGNAGFRVAAIPETLGRTTLGSVRIGDKVNVEIDIIVKVVRRQLENILPKDELLTVERLRQMGF